MLAGPPRLSGDLPAAEAGGVSSQEGGGDGEEGWGEVGARCGFAQPALRERDTDAAGVLGGGAGGTRTRILAAW